LITNISGSVSDGTYALSDPAGTGSVDLPPGGNVSYVGAGNATMTVTYSTSFLSSVTLSVTGSCSRRPTATPTDTPAATNTPTNTPPSAPALSVQGACAGAISNTAIFTVTNNGGDMTAPYSYSVTDANGNVADSGAINLAAGQSVTLSVSGNTASFTFTSSSDASLTTVVDMTTCATTTNSSLSITGSCTANSGEATFVVTNNGSAMTSPINYSIVDADGNIAGSGTINLGENQSATIKVTGSSSAYVFVSPDDSALTAFVDMTVCTVQPSPTATPPPANLTITGACTNVAGTATFVIANNGADMSVPYPYTITDASGTVVQAGAVSLLGGQSITMTVTGTSANYTFASSSAASLTTIADMTACATPPPPPPSLTATGVCVSEGVAQFIITNNGGAMTSPGNYTITDEAGNVVETGTYQLKAGESLTVTVSGASGVLILVLADAAGTTTRAALADCVEPDLSVAPAEPEICIQCLVFHTFRDGNLEIYRLNGIEGQPDAKLYNLSKDESVDSRPSRAPNDSWVVFQSNRDGNVELYYTDLLGSGEAARLTNNPFNDINPMYAPDAHTVVFQSDRNGAFDLFTIDQQTGREVQLTSSLAHDVNPFYSPNIQKLVFQSNRNGNWDLFILDVETGTEFQLTNSLQNETFPTWSPNGRQIAFILEENGATDLYVIDLEGRSQRRITTDGRTVNAVWSPEGDRIAYQSERNGNLDIYSYDFRDNKEYRVTDYEGQDSGPTWDCGGTNLAFTSIRDGDPNIFQVFWQGGSAGNMTIDPATDKWSQWRPSNDVSSTGY
jgi:Tol biopolymer transport system component